jgi:YggT family protein
MSELGFVLNQAVGLFATSLVVVILARVVLSWVYPNVHNTLVFWVWRLSEPILDPIRRMLPRTGGMDLSPWVALILIFILRRVIFNILYNVF